MSPAAALAVLGCVLLCLVAQVVFDFFFDVTFDATKEAVFRRPSFAQRRGRSRRLLRSGFLSGVLAACAAFMVLAIKTNGYSDDDLSARVFLAVATGLAVLSSVLLSAWWRRAGRPRHD